MYSAEFDYYRAGSVAEASDLLQKNPGAKLLAGGHSLIPLLKLRLAAPPALIDIGRIAELKGVTVTDGMVRIGALTTHAELAASADAARALSGAGRGGRQVGDPAVRNRGTIGGNVAHADPGVGSADRAQRARRPVHGDRSGRHEDHRRRRLLHRHDDDRAWRARSAHGDRGSGEDARPGDGVREVHASRVAVRRHRRRRRPDRERRHLHRSGGGDRRPRPPADARVVGRTGAGRSGAVRRDDRRRRPPRSPRISDADILGDLYASAEYRKAVAPVWVRRALPRRRSGR